MPKQVVPTVGYVAVLVFVLAGCTNTPPVTKDDAAEPGAAAPASELPPKTVEFDGRSWTWTEEHPPSFSGRAMAGDIYNCDDPDLRLLDLTRGHQVYQRILIVQTRGEGEAWIDHGREEWWLKNGGHGYCHNEMGKIHGVQLEWFANGRLQLKRAWSHGKQHGLEEWWYEGGQKRQETHYSNDVVISDQWWDKDGRPMNNEQ